MRIPIADTLCVGQASRRISFVFHAAACSFFHAINLRYHLAGKAVEGERLLGQKKP
jgi:hypothetical protein